MHVSELMRRFSAGRLAAYGIRVAAIIAYLLLTNAGFLQRIVLLQEQGRWGTLVGFLGVWGLSLAALLTAAFQANRWLRFGWALVIALSTGIGFAYHRASGSDIGVLDALSLWNARHDASRAAEFYASDFYWLAIVLLAGFVLFAIPPVPARMRWLTRLAWLPTLPIVAIAAIVVVKEGGGSQVLPTQFAPLSVGLVVGSKIAVHPLLQRSNVSWTWRGPFAMAAPRADTLPPRTPITHAPQVRHIVILVDESVRGDYIDWTPGNPYTPELARLKSAIVNFGPAASGGNCSHYSNAILRFTAARTGLGQKVLTNPTLWQYAKKAGFRTVYIDAQGAFNRNPGKLQNFMTAEEVRNIDSFNALDQSITPPALDDRLLDIVLRELNSDEPVLIYANKNGAHFPYDQGYPKAAQVFHASMDEVAQDTTQGRINSFRNVVKWSVDRFFKRMFDEATLKDTVVIYTSDHGQAFDPRRLTHCTVEDPDPREGLVPLFVIADHNDLRAKFATAAEASRGYASHFAIIPTVLELLGYGHSDVESLYGESLLKTNVRAPAFTSGDIFGLFSSTPRWHALDLQHNYLEPVAQTPTTRPPSAAARGARESSGSGF